MGGVIGTSLYFKSESLYEKLDEISDKNNETVLTKVGGDSFKIVNSDGTEYSITDEEQKKLLADSAYYKFNDGDRYYESVTYTLITSDGTKFEMLDNGVVGRVTYTDGTSSYIYAYDIYISICNILPEPESPYEEYDDLENYEDE